MPVPGSMAPQLRRSCRPPDSRVGVNPITVPAPTRRGTSSAAAARARTSTCAPAPRPRPVTPRRPRRCGTSSGARLEQAVEQSGGRAAAVLSSLDQRVAATWCVTQRNAIGTRYRGALGRAGGRSRAPTAADLIDPRREAPSKAARTRSADADQSTLQLSYAPARSVTRRSTTIQSPPRFSITSTIDSTFTPGHPYASGNWMPASAISTLPS